MKYFAALLLSAVLFVACGDDSSSSAPVPDPSEESSSSVEKTNESSSSAKPTSSEDKQSSSSVKKEDSSSSAVKASSSSVTPKSSSSGEVKQSSSSVVASSSSVVGESSSSSFDKEFNGSLWRAGAYKAFVDPRDNREYYYIQITGKDTAGKAATIKVMAENLNVGEFIRGRKNQEDDNKIERYCYDNDTTNCIKYGGLYQWAEMMQLPSRCNTESCADLIKPNHQGICPSGWRLLTYNDYYIVVHADNNEDGVKGTRAGCFGGSDDTGYSLIGAGENWDYSFTNLNGATYWHYPEEASEETSKVSYQSPSEKYNPVAQKMKVFGFSVRCVMVE